MGEVQLVGNGLPLFVRARRNGQVEEGASGEIVRILVAESKFRLRSISELNF